jgi:hypothetical protein
MTQPSLNKIIRIVCILFIISLFIAFYVSIFIIFHNNGNNNNNKITNNSSNNSWIITYNQSLYENNSKYFHF